MEKVQRERLLTNRMIRECPLICSPPLQCHSSKEGALKNDIVIELVEMGVDVYGFRFLYVGVGRWEKKEVNCGKVIPKGKVLWCLEHHGAKAYHTFHSSALAWLSQLHFSILKPIFYWFHSAIIYYSLYPFPTSWNFLNFLQTRLFFIFRSPVSKTVCLNKLLN